MPATLMFERAPTTPSDPPGAQQAGMQRPGELLGVSSIAPGSGPYGTVGSSANIRGSRASRLQSPPAASPTKREEGRSKRWWGYRARISPKAYLSLMEGWIPELTVGLGSSICRHRRWRGAAPDRRRVLDKCHKERSREARSRPTARHGRGGATRSALAVPMRAHHHTSRSRRAAAWESLLPFQSSPWWAGVRAATRRAHAGVGQHRHRRASDRHRGELAPRQPPGARESGAARGSCPCRRQKLGRLCAH